MTERYDLILRGGLVVDYATQREEVADVAVAGGKITTIAREIDPAQGTDVFDVTGCWVVPGIIDLHVHASAWLGGRWGHKMLAQAGVTTALDMSGPVDSVLDLARDYGVGLNLACLQYVRPGHTVSDTDPAVPEIERLLDSSLRKGALGLKLLGGHYPLTPDATARVITAANKRQAYVAFHAGTLAHGSNIDGLREAVALADGQALHVAHINSYCRGAVRPYMVETEEAVALLTVHPRIRSESYLSPFNGTSGKCTGGVPESLVTQKCLCDGGFAATEEGLAAAIESGWAQVNMPSGGSIVLADGPAALAYWRQQRTDTTVSFAVNPPEPRLRLAIAKRPAGGFVVDAISTDGGGIPRNVIIAMGLSLVKLQALTRQEFVQKTSYNPARILGLAEKGHFRPGADADITVIDPGRQRAVMTVVNGRIVMYDGYVCGRGAQIVTTALGRDYVRDKGLTPVVVDLADSAFYKGLSPAGE